MGLFDFMKPKQSAEAQFVSEQQFRTNRAKQMEVNPEVMEQLREIGVTEENELKLEYFFYTNTAEKAKAFADELVKLNYSAASKPAADGKGLFVVTGWTTKMKMLDEVVTSWSEQMCELGYKFDCEFDGWGTSPDQQD